MRLSTTLIAATATVVVNVCHGQNEGNSHYKINDNNNNMKPWLPGDYPQAHHEQCWRRISSSQATTATQQEPSLRSCDPDEVFSDKDWAEIDRALWNTPPKLHVLCGTNHEMHEFSVQIAVAVTRKLNLREYRGYEDPQSKGAEVFARKLHDQWGVGQVVGAECQGNVAGAGTGVLIFLSDLDRTVYISRGDALRDILTNRRLDRIIEHTMKPFLQRQRYRDAILHALNDIHEHLQKGKPDTWERLTDFFVQYSGLVWIGLLFGFVGWNIRREQAERRRYAEAAAHLDEIDRARAEALQGHFQMDSCPICLEKFQSTENHGDERPTIGSDGAPLKLLRCGHCFDESCWSEWVQTGRGQVDKCPICQQSVGRSETEPVSNAPDAATTEPAPDVATHDNTQETAYAYAATSNAFGRHSNANASSLRRYQYERNFRLARLATRYPRFITTQQMQRWTSSTYDGSLVRDPTFVQNDPALRSARAHGNSSSSGTSSRKSSMGSSGTSSFGGGRSGGGRGGRW